MRSRDEFSERTKLKLAQRACYLCSNPDCMRITVGPNSIPDESTMLGVAAHICAASPGGRRYDHTMTSRERSSIENGIWLCQTCAKLIDSDEVKYSPAVLRKWKVEHETLISKEQLKPEVMKKAFLEAFPKKVTAKSLVDAGFIPEKVHKILEAQDKASQQKNGRLVKFLNSYVGKELDGVPPVWRALIAGFPIIGHDIGSKSLIQLAELAREMHPYLSKEVRKEYHKRVQPILIGILAEVQAFLDDSARVGGLPLAIMDYPPPTWKDWFPWLWFRERSWKVDESLVGGYWTYAIPKKVFDQGIEIDKTWAGFLYDIISRLPDPDKQKGKLISKGNLLGMIVFWCSTAPEDFEPALTKIIRNPVSSSDNTLAGIYKLWQESSDKSTE